MKAISPSRENGNFAGISLPVWRKYQVWAKATRQVSALMQLFAVNIATTCSLVLWCCWLGGRKGIRPVKTEWWGAGVVVCLEQGAVLHMAQLMPLPLTVSCFSKIQIGFTFLVLAHPGSPGKRAVKRVCVCVCCSLVLWPSIVLRIF